MTMFNDNSSAASTAVNTDFPRAPLPTSHENISCLLSRFGLSHSLDFLGKTIVFEYLDPQLRPYFPKQTARVVAVLVTDSALNRPLELEIAVEDEDSDFISLDGIELLSVA